MLQGVHNGTTTGNVLELMKQWKDDLNDDEDGKCADTSADTKASIDLNSNPGGKALKDKSELNHKTTVSCCVVSTCCFCI